MSKRNFSNVLFLTPATPLQPRCFLNNNRNPMLFKGHISAKMQKYRGAPAPTSENNPFPSKVDHKPVSQSNVWTHFVSSSISHKKGSARSYLFLSAVTFLKVGSSRGKWITNFSRAQTAGKSVRLYIGKGSPYAIKMRRGEPSCIDRGRRSARRFLLRAQKQIIPVGGSAPVFPVMGLFPDHTCIFKVLDCPLHRTA